MTQPIYDHLLLLTEISQLLTFVDVDKVMERVIKLMTSAVGAQKASLFLHQESNVNWDHIFLMRDLKPNETFVVLRTVLDDGLAGWVIRYKTTALVHDTETDERWHVFEDDTNTVRSALCVPFLHEDEVLAVLTLVHPEPNHFNEHHVRLMTIAANQASVAILNAQLFSQLQAQQQQLEAILQAIPGILFVLNSDGKILMVNGMAQDFLSRDTPYSHREIVNKYLHDFAPDHTALATIDRTVTNETLIDGLWTFVTRSEESGQDFQVTMGMWESPAQRTGGYVIVMHDVSALRDLSRFKDEMLKIVSHDLRTPLALIISAHNMLDLDMPPLPDDSAIPQFMDIIEQSTTRMQTLIDELLRAETSNQQQVNPTDIIQSVYDDMKPVADQREQNLVLDLKLKNSDTIVVDPMLIHESMSNYVGNAIKYTQEKGTITIRARLEQHRFYFEVEDNGIGIGPEDIERVFDPYFQSDSARKKGSSNGHGVGLNLVKTIVERHHGRCWVKSELGKGSLFGFWLPA